MKHENDRSGRTAVLLEPHPFCHAALGSLLARFDMKVAGAATSASTAMALLEEHKPHLLVVELDLPEGRDEALRVISRGRALDPSLTVVVLTGSNDPGLIDDAFDAGASAYILKTTEPDAVATAIRQAFEPSIYLARPRVTQSSTPATCHPVPKLTRREVEILKLVSEGRSNRQVGQLLWVTDQTVKFHLANIYRKLGVGSRHDAARWAMEHGVLELVESGEVVTIAEGNGTGNGNGKTGGNGNGTGNGSIAARATPLPARRATGTVFAARERRREGTSQ